MNACCLRVLLAEDDALLAADLEACLREAGYEVMAIEARGDCALTAARLLQPDVVVLNASLRGPLDGPAVAAALRTGSSLPVAVVFVTSQPMLPTPLSAHAAQSAVPARPLLGAQLCQAVHTALSNIWQERPAA